MSDIVNKSQKNDTTNSQVSSGQRSHGDEKKLSKFDKLLAHMSRYKYRQVILTITLISLSAYSPLALFQTLSLVQTFMNIFMNCLIDLTVGAAVYTHNIF
jgi:hypothetical protein